MKNKIKPLATIALILLIYSVYAQVKVYKNPDPAQSSGYDLASKVYQVRVKQNGKEVESYVYASMTNFDHPKLQSDFNHWTTFESKGEIEITVTQLNGDIKGATIYPKRHNITPSIYKNELKFKVSNNSKLFVDIEGMEEHPLFIFNDVIEQNIPSKKDKNVIWFEAGKVHHVGLQYSIPNGKTVYIEGGAVVWGTLICEDGPKKTSIRGGGVITTRSDERKPGSINIPFCTIYGVKTDIAIDRVTITDPVKFCILGRSLVETSNVKLFAWYHQTDGWGGGDNSYIDDSFIKVFDDNVKLYGNNQKATNLVIYQQHNGAPFQLSWGGQSGHNCLADHIDIVKCWVDKKGGDGNSALLNLRTGSTRPISNITIRNIRADQGIYQIIGIGNNKASLVKNLLLENIAINGKQAYKSYLTTENRDLLKQVSFKNVTIGGICISTEGISLENVSMSEVVIECK